MSILDTDLGFGYKYEPTKNMSSYEAIFSKLTEHGFGFENGIMKSGPKYNPEK